MLMIRLLRSLCLSIPDLPLRWHLNTFGPAGATRDAPDLANSFRKLADGYTEMLFLQLARARQVELEEVYRTTDALDAEIDKTYS